MAWSSALSRSSTNLCLPCCSRPSSLWSSATSPQWFVSFGSHRKTGNCDLKHCLPVFRSELFFHGCSVDHHSIQCHYSDSPHGWWVMDLLFSSSWSGSAASADLLRKRVSVTKSVLKCWGKVRDYRILCEQPIWFQTFRTRQQPPSGWHESESKKSKKHRVFQKSSWLSLTCFRRASTSVSATSSFFSRIPIRFSAFTRSPLAPEYHSYLSRSRSVEPKFWKQESVS